MWDRLWYQKIFLNHSIGLRANLIAIGNWKSLYLRPALSLRNCVIYLFSLISAPGALQIESKNPFYFITLISSSPFFCYVDIGRNKGEGAYWGEGAN